MLLRSPHEPLGSVLCVGRISVCGNGAAFSVSRLVEFETDAVRAMQECRSVGWAGGRGDGVGSISLDRICKFSARVFGLVRCVELECTDTSVVLVANCRDASSTRLSGRLAFR